MERHLDMPVQPFAGAFESTHKRPSQEPGRMRRITWHVNSRTMLEPLFWSQEPKLFDPRRGEPTCIQNLRAGRPAEGLANRCGEGPLPQSEALGTNGVFIVVPIDFSPSSLAAVEVSTSLAGGTNARLLFCHAMRPQVIPFDRAFPPWVARKSRSEVRQMMEPFMKSAREANVPASCLIEKGTLAGVTLHVARRYQAALIVLASRPRGIWSRLIFGPTAAEQIAREADGHVMVVRLDAE